MIVLTELTKLYNNFPAVQELDLEVKDGEIMGIIGHNGAGKTTTLKMILGLIEPTSGQVEVMGRDMTKDSLYVKQHIGYLPEESSLYENITADEYLLFFSELYKMPRKLARDRIDLLLSSLDLDKRDKLTGELSKGMKRKVAIARALLHDPTLLILDEPNSGLDPLTSFFIINYLKTLREQGKTILLSAHNLFHVLVVCDTMEAIRQRLGRRQYEVIFKSDERLDYEQNDGNYILRTDEVSEIADMLDRISANKWALVNLSVTESALEDIYVKMMTES